MNVRGETNTRISENKEISDIKKILGLEMNREYKTIEDVHKHLRYSKVMFMCDADLDGNHIKGLGINLFQSVWPSLIQIPGFISFMSTPILKARKGTQELAFYNEGEYQKWKDEITEEVVKNWKIKYYKGLGTSTGKEFREYFKEKKIVGFEYSEQSDDLIDMIFNKKRADDRKGWLREYDRSLYLDTTHSSIPYEEFINKELIHFSKYDCDRSIPNLMDGLKISLRKILFSAFKKKLTTEIKVAQFSGYISENSCYHHGEASLNAAIIGMAQNFVGSNNINLFMPNGQMGTRLMGGQDAASERYIYTQLSRITRCIFPEKDDPILQYLNDDGTPVEPIYYAPISPMVLVNGSKGIGTGFSTHVLSYHPNDIIQYLKNKLMGEENTITFIPYYDGFTGEITQLKEGQFMIRGSYEILTMDKIRITELPVGVWTNDYKEFLESLTETTDTKTGKKVPPVIKDYDDMSKDTTIDFIITLQKGKLEELTATPDGIYKQFKLISTVSTTNMHLFDADDKLKKYNTIPEIIDDYYVKRLEMYQIRKDYLINEIQRALILLDNKARYIQENLNGTIDLRKKKREEVNKMLTDKGYDMVNGDEDYKYLTRMPMDSVTEENVKKLMDEQEKKNKELIDIQNTTIPEMWLQELLILEEEYISFKGEKDRMMDSSVVLKKKPKSKKVKKVEE
jgi:DNA topoisomerase-2